MQDDDSTCCKLTMRCSSTSGIKILSALRQPPTTTKLTVLPWDCTSLTNDMLDALGLGLRSQSHFFNALLARHPKTPAREHIGTGWQISDDIVVLGQYVSTLVRDHLPANPDASPIILIAGVDQTHLQVEKDFHGRFPILKLATQATEKTPSPVDQLPEWIKDYFRGIEFDIQKQRDHGVHDMGPAFSPVAALLQFSLPLIRLECKPTRVYYLQATKPRRTDADEKSPKHVFKMRYLLRRMIEDLEDNSLRLRGYIHS